MWSFGHQNLKLPRDFFHHYTLQQFIALTDRYHEEQDYWHSQHYAQMHNIHRGKDARPIDHQDLMRVKRKPRTKAEVRKSLVSKNTMKSLSMFATAHNAYVEKSGRSMTRKRGTR